MISYLSNKLASYLVKANCIVDEEFSLYAYGLFLLIANVIFIIILFIFGAIFHCIIENLVFYISFRAIRSFAGGYHADTEMRCEILTTLSFFITTLAIFLSEQQNVQIIVLIFAIIAIPIIAVFSPLDTPAKPLDDDEKKKYRKISLVILSAITFIIIISTIIRIKLLIVPCCLSLILESILLVAGVIKGRLVSGH